MEITMIKTVTTSSIKYEKDETYTIDEVTAKQFIKAGLAIETGSKKASKKG